MRRRTQPAGGAEAEFEAEPQRVLLDPAAVAFSQETIDATMQRDGEDVGIERALSDLAARVGRARRLYGLIASDERARDEIARVLHGFPPLLVAPIEIAEGAEAGGPRVAYVARDNARLWLLKRLREVLPPPVAASVAVPARVVPLEELRADVHCAEGRVFVETRVRTSKGEATPAFNFVAVKRARARYDECFARDVLFFLLALAAAVFLYTSFNSRGPSSPEASGD